MFSFPSVRNKDILFSFFTHLFCSAFPVIFLLHGNVNTLGDIIFYEVGNIINYNFFVKFAAECHGAKAACVLVKGIPAS